MPFSLADTNDDGREDIVAVIVKKSGADRFNVVSLHGGEHLQALWPIRDAADEVIRVEILEMGAKPGNRERWYRIRNVTPSQPFAGWGICYDNEQPGLCDEPLSP